MQCDSCRSRKIRCDRGNPCSNCRASKLTCQTTAPTQKAQRQRVHISDEYEKKIDRIEDRLAGIEIVLEKLANKLGNLDIQNADTGTHSRSSKTGRSPHSSTDVHADTPAPFEGDTSMNIQSEFARELLEKAVGSTPSIGQNAEIKAALNMLQDMVSKQNTLKSTTSDPQPFLSRDLSGINAAKLPHPPWKVSKEILDNASIHPTMCFTIIFPFIKIRDLVQTLNEAYETPEDCPPVRRILLYGVLYNLITEYMVIPYPGGEVDHFQQYANQCKMQLETAMSQLELATPPSYDSIMALLLATSYGIEICKPSLCWLLNTTAITQAQSLGYHRVSTMKDDSPEERSGKINTFWFLYMMDKTLSLRLGRASAIQDWDLSLPFLDPHARDLSDFATMPVAITQQVYWVKVAQIQGRIYEHLFSPASFTKSLQERVQAANELGLAMDQAWSERGNATVLDFVFQGTALKDMRKPVLPPEERLFSAQNPHRKRAEDMLNPTPVGHIRGGDSIPRRTMQDALDAFGEIFHFSDIVVHFSTLTLIQRATSPDNITFTPDCLESARKSLKAHMRCSEQFNVKGNENLWSGYVHWSLLQAPFTPFIVLFCNIITHCNEQDLITLSDFVISLDSARATSEGAERLYKVCHLFLLVAKHYLEAKRNEANAQRGSVNQDGFYVTNPPNTSNATTQQLDANGMNQFDPYLSALGLLPNNPWSNIPSGPYASTMGPNTFQGLDDNTMMQQNTVQEWFSGSRYIMGLMEDDITMPDFNNL